LSKYVIKCDNCNNSWVKTSSNTWICAKCGTDHARKIVEPEFSIERHELEKQALYTKKTEILKQIAVLTKQVDKLEREYLVLEKEEKRLCKIDVQIYEQKLKKKEN